MLKLRSVLLNSKAAIDLASIMVGIIVIGLIGGVIAATVFAVIPWAQDNAAKQQLDSIHTAQNAAFGLSADPSRELTAGQERNSFTNSQGLAGAGLLTLSETGTYCTVQFDDGKNYIGWVKSASGKIFYSTNNNKTAKDNSSLTSLPCATAPIGEGNTQIPVGGYNPGVAVPGETTPAAESGEEEVSGEGETTTPPAGPVYARAAAWDFENGQVATWGSPSQNSATQVTTAQKHSGARSLSVHSYGSGTNSIRAQVNYIEHEVGVKYRVTAWIYQPKGTTGSQIIVGAVPSASTAVQNSPGVWVEHQTEYVATSNSHNLMFNINRGTAYGDYVMYVDDVVIEKVS